MIGPLHGVWLVSHWVKGGGEAGGSSKVGGNRVGCGGARRGGNIIVYIYMPDIRDWSLITGRGGATKHEGGAREVLPLRIGWTEVFFSHAEEGHKTFYG